MGKRKQWAEELLVRVLPIWHGQVEFACDLMERSIGGLAAKFSGIVSKLESTHEHNQGTERGECNEKQQEVLDAIAQLHRLLAQDDKQECKKQIQRIEEKFLELTREYTDYFERNRQGNCEIKSQVEEILVDLQFQDRASQILRTVVKTQIQLHELVTDSSEMRKSGSKGTEEFDADKWIEGMREQYAMEDQYQIHDGKVKAEGKQLDEITFF